jgi:hypothetical protein
MSDNKGIFWNGQLRCLTGPDKNLWFTESGAGQFGRITTRGAVTDFPIWL